MADILGSGDMHGQAAVPPAPKPTFEQELVCLIDKHWLRFHTNTPSEILAEVMTTAVDTYESALLKRSKHFNRSTGIEDYPHVAPGSSYPG